MSTFLVVLVVTLLAFSDTFLTISNGNKDPTDRFVESIPHSIVFTYRIILGDF